MRPLLILSILVIHCHGEPFRDDYKYSFPHIKNEEDIYHDFVYLFFPENYDRLRTHVVIKRINEGETGDSHCAGVYLQVAAIATAASCVSTDDVLEIHQLSQTDPPIFTLNETGSFKIIHHPEYDPSTVANDVAIIFTSHEEGGELVEAYFDLKPENFMGDDFFMFGNGKYTGNPEASYEYFAKLQIRILDEATCKHKLHIPGTFEGFDPKKMVCGIGLDDREQMIGPVASVDWGAGLYKLHHETGKYIFYGMAIDIYPNVPDLSRPSVFLRASSYYEWFFKQYFIHHKEKEKDRPTSSDIIHQNKEVTI